MSVDLLGMRRTGLPNDDVALVRHFGGFLSLELGSPTVQIQT